MPEVVVNLTAPPIPPSKIPKFMSFMSSNRSTKIVTAVAAGVISLSMVSFAVFTALTNNKSFDKSHQIGNTTQGAVPAETNTTAKSSAALPGGGVAVGVGGTSGTNSPVVKLTATPASVPLGGVTQLDWSVTNNPKTCVASEDWSGSKASTGSEKSQAMTKNQTYIYTLTCKTATGTGFATVSVDAIAQGGTGSVATRPTVSLAATPSQTYTGGVSSLSWSVSNSPSGCTASGDWSGSKAVNGQETTAPLSSVKTYSFTLTCNNSAGTGYATATVSVTDPPPNVPLVTIISNPVSPVTVGTNVTLTWSVTNNPTSCTASDNWTGSKSASGSFNTGALAVGNYTYTLTCGNSAGSTNSAVPISVVPPPPAVSLTVNPSSTTVGTAVTLTWSNTNSPSSCTASGDWSGAITPTSGGTRSFTPATNKTYLFSLSCTNAGGTNSQNNVPLVVTLPAPPSVTITASPISVTTGSTSTITWSTTGTVTSCTASGTGAGWSGTKLSNGTFNTGKLNTVGTFSYNLSCTNAGGSGSAGTSVSVSSGVVTNPPVVTITATPASIGTGSSSTISWSATNSPTSCTASGTGTGWSGSKSASGTQSSGTMNTAGSFTYILTCSNSAGSGSQTATLTVVAVPIVTISVSPTTLTAGPSATATVTWSATASPTSCSAGGSWSGSKAGSGSSTVGPITTAGTYTYTLTCTNAGGTGPAGSTSLTATTAAATYCSGSTPCYGPNDLALHVTAADCWGYNVNRVVNVTSLNSGYHKSQQGNLLPSGFTSVCGNVNLGTYLSGGASIPGLGSHNHGSAPKGNTGTIGSYLVGYYDATKP